MKIDLTDSDGGSHSIGYSDGTEVALAPWDFGGNCATGYATAISDDAGTTLLAIETDDATALFTSVVCTTTETGANLAIEEAIPVSRTVSIDFPTYAEGTADDRCSQTFAFANIAGDSVPSSLSLADDGTVTFETTQELTVTFDIVVTNSGSSDGTTTETTITGF